MSYQKLQKKSMGLEVVDFVSAFHSARTQYLEFRHLPNIIAYQDASNTIIKKLFLHAEDVFVQLEMAWDGLQGVPVHVDLKFLFEESLITVISVRC